MRNGEISTRARVGAEPDDCESKGIVVNREFAGWVRRESGNVNIGGRGIGRMVAIVCAASIVGVAVLAVMVVGRVQRNPGASGRDLEDCTGVQVEGAMLIAAVIGVALAGGIGWWTARRVSNIVDRAIGRFVAEASHELRTPLTVLHTRLQLLLLRNSLDDKVVVVVEQLLNDARVLAETINKLLGQRSARL